MSPFDPVAAPDQERVLEGLARDDLFTVVLEHFMTDTAQYADVILPATTQLEHWDIHLSYGHTDVMLNRPALAPRGDARSNTWVFRELARRMGFDEPCFRDDDETICRGAFAPSDVDFAAFSHSALVRIVDEICLQMHLLNLSFVLAVGKRAGTASCAIAIIVMSVTPSGSRMKDL